MIFSAGITESARNDIVRNGVAPLQPSAAAASLQARLCAITSSSVASESRPATGSGHSAATLPPSTATMPPLSSTTRSTAVSMSSSEAPITTTLWASWATVEASAPRRSPELPTNPRPERGPSRGGARPQRSSPGRAPGRRPRSRPRRSARSTSDSVTTWSATSPIARVAPPSHATAKRAGDRRDAHGLPDPVRHLDARLADGAGRP